MTWVAVAIGGSAVLGAVTSSNAASSAASGARDAANQANATSQGQFNQSQWAQQPWTQAGGNAINQLSYLMGLGNPSTSHKTQANFDADKYLAANPDAQAWIAANQQLGRYYSAWDHYVADGSHRAGDFWNNATPAQGGGNGQMGAFGSLAQPFSMDKFQADPGYAFRLAEGQKALERSGAAKGMSLSGAQQKALTAYGQGIGAQEYNAAYGRYQNDQSTLFNRLSGIAGTGQQANQYLGQLGMNTANTQGNNLMGAATVAGNAGMANAGMWGNALNSGINQWQNYNMWNQMQGGLQSPYNYVQPGNSSTWATNVPNNPGTLPVLPG